MSSCCRPDDYGRMFNRRYARHDARRYARRGLVGSARAVVDGLRARAPGARVLEVGGGIGSIHVELLEAGAASAANIELSPSYEAEAARLAEAAGVTDRVERRVGDFLANGSLEDADLVVLHRVVCCYPDMPAMVAAAGRKALRALALTYPRDRWWVRLGFRATNLALRLWRSSFRVFVHPPAEIMRVAAAQGLAEVSRHRDPLWETVILERPAA